jgi:hypothetical protein
MMLLLAGGLLWLLAVLVILSVCRAAARADENEAGRRIVRAGRRSASVGMAAVVITVPMHGETAEARRAPTCHNGAVTFEAAPAKARRALSCEIDRVRAKRGLRRLSDNPLLDRASRRHAADMVRRRYFSHETPAGAGPADRARRAGYVKSSCSWRLGEVLAWGVAGRSTAAATVRAWMDSPGHRRILVSRRYRELGSAMVDGTPEARYPSGVTVAAEFGRRRC